VHDTSTQYDWRVCKIGASSQSSTLSSSAGSATRAHLPGAPSHVHDFLRDYRYGPDYLTPRREALGLYHEIHEIVMTQTSLRSGAQELLRRDRSASRSRWPRAPLALLGPACEPA